jgi:hypothetical protein
MAFVFIPKVNLWILRQTMEFFYMPAALPGHCEQSMDGVSVYEIPSA